MPKISVVSLLEGVANNPTNKATIDRALHALQKAMENQIGKREIRKVQGAVEVLVKASTEGLSPAQVDGLKAAMRKIPTELSIDPERAGNTGQSRQLLGWRNIPGGKLRAF